MKHVFVLVVIIALIEGCSKNKVESFYDNNFEAQGNWSESPLIIKGHAKSGLYSTITDSSIEYSQTARIKIADLFNKPSGTVKVSAWVMTKDSDSKAKLVISLDKEGKSLVWNGIDIKPAVKNAENWYEVTCELKLPAKTDTSATILIYGWNNSGNGLVFWDDFKVKVE